MNIWTVYDARNVNDKGSYKISFEDHIPEFRAPVWTDRGPIESKIE